jgi:hypothetical protein
MVYVVSRGAALEIGGRFEANTGLASHPNYISAAPSEVDPVNLSRSDIHACTCEMSEARVAKRKTHTKSRKGCFQCKQRHTKV